MIQFQFLGTGAADYDWSKIGAPGIHGSAGTIIDGKILIDAGDCGYENLTRFQIDFDALNAIFFTHSHHDHFRPETVEKIRAARKTNQKLEIWASPEITRQLPSDAYHLHMIRPGTDFSCCGFQVTSLWASHPLGNFHEEPMHYLFQKEGKNMLYALDGAWMAARTRQLLTIRKIALDLIVWDATGYEEGHFRSFEHNDMGMIRLMLPALREWGIVTNDTTVILDHLARTLWPESQKEREAAVADDGCLVAYDGMEFAL
ncbi:MAG: MBL fold metallo-hydrolase [Victivallaceae bacterium]|nr:MBL fold metallo-hydrolase [Victivallaceae bacterium]